MKGKHETPDPRASSLFTAGVMLVIFWHLLHVSMPFLQPLFWAGILAVVFYPLYVKLCVKFHDNGSRAAGLLTVLLVLLIAPLIIWGVVEAMREIVEFAEAAHRSIQEGSFQRQTRRMFSAQWIHQAERTLFGQAGMLQENLPQWAAGAAQNIGSFAAVHIAGVTKSMFITTAKTLLTVFMLFFFLRDGSKFIWFVMDLIPLEGKHKAKILAETRDVTHAVIEGIFMMALLKGALAAILFLACGVSYAPLLGIATIFASLIPFIGSAAVWLPVGIMFAIQGDYVRAVAVLASGMLIINPVDNVLQPIVVGKKIHMPFSLLMLAMLGGMMSYGMAGLFIGPLLLALFLAFVPIYHEKFFHRFRRGAAPGEISVSPGVGSLVKEDKAA